MLAVYLVRNRAPAGVEYFFVTLPCGLLIVAVITQALNNSLLKQNHSPDGVLRLLR